MGMPTPGVVPEPAKNRPGTRLSTLRGRKGPDCISVWARANGVPASMPWACQSTGVTNCSVTMPAPSARSASTGVTARRRPGLSHSIRRSAVAGTVTTQAAAISETIDRMFDNSLAETLTETEEAFNLSFISMASSIVLGLQIISILVIGIILLVLGNTMAMTARERVNEYAVMKTLGFGSFHIAGVILGESMLIAAFGGLLGLAITFPINGLIKVALSNFFPIVNVELLTLGLGMTASLVVGMLAAIFPTIKALRTPIVDGLRIID